MSVTDLGTAVKTLVVHEPMLVSRPAAATLKYQTDNASFSRPEGVIVISPVRLTGVFIREEFESTGVRVDFIR